MSAVVVLGVGNILLCDEGAGVHAVNRMMERYAFPDDLQIYDGGVTGMVGLLPIIEETDHLILLDAVNSDDPPGTVKRFTLDQFKMAVPQKLSGHDIGIIECLVIAETLGKAPKSVVVIGVTPEDYATYTMEPTAVVAEAIDQMIELALAELKCHGIKELSYQRCHPYGDIP